MKLGFDKLLDGYKDAVDYGEGADLAVLGGSDSYQKALPISSQSLVQGRGKSFPVRGARHEGLWYATPGLWVCRAFGRFTHKT